MFWSRSKKVRATPSCISRQIHPRPAWVESKANVETWLLKNKFPRVAQLTTDNFISIMKNPTEPFVVLAALSTEDNKLDENVALLKRAAKHWEQQEGSGELVRGAVFVWMDASKWGSWLKGQYGIKKARLPSVVVADHQVRNSCDFSSQRNVRGWLIARPVEINLLGFGYALDANQT